MVYPPPSGWDTAGGIPPYDESRAHLEQRDEQGQGSFYQRGLEHRSGAVSQLAEEKRDQAGGPKHLDCLV